jgi:protein-tyrosine phosphatase
MKQPSEIITGLYLGNDKNSEDDSNSYSMIVNCTLNLPFTISGTEQVRIPINDDPYDSIPLFQILRDTDVLDRMHNHLTNKSNILVHCQAGAQRSPTVVACYLLKFYNMSANDAINFVKSKRQEAFFWTINFQKTIDRFYTHTSSIKSD